MNCPKEFTLFSHSTTLSRSILILKFCVFNLNLKINDDFYLYYYEIDELNIIFVSSKSCCRQCLLFFIYIFIHFKCKKKNY